MYLRDAVSLAAGAVLANRLRSFLTALGIAIGITAVVLLTSIGSGIHRFVLDEFTQFGSNLIAINPGKATTFGGSVGVFGSTRPLTLEDAEALGQLPEVRVAEPVLLGNAEVESANRRRHTNVYGVGPDFPEVFRAQVAIGRYLPHDNPQNARQFAVLGHKLKQELFGNTSPLGQRLRVGGQRYLIIGVMEPKGQMLGFDIDDTVYIPTARALELFNRDGLMEIDILYRDNYTQEEVVRAITRLLTARHGDEDFTITTQQQMLDVLNSVLGVLTFAVGALGGISLVVGGIGILTIMTISVRERTGEIGLLRALGTEQRQIHLLFLGEAATLAAIGGLAGLALGIGLARLLNLALPALPVQVDWFYVIAAELLATAIGLAAGVIPARSAARLDPVDALRTE